MQHRMNWIQLVACLLLLTGVGAICGATSSASPDDDTTSNSARRGPITNGLRIFCCGHSFHFYVPAMLEEMAKSAGIMGQEIVGTSMIGGSKVIQHWNVKDEDNKAKQALEAGRVDLLTLTPIYLPDDGIEKFAQLGLEHNPNIRITVQEFWLPFDVYEPHIYDEPKIPPPATVDHNAASGKMLRTIHARYFREMDALIVAINKKLGKQVLFVVPAGQAVIALREKIIAGKAPGLKVQEDLFVDPLGHPSPPLEALVTYCHFAVIYRRSPIGLPVPPVLAQSRVPAGDVPALNRLLQELAWNAVTHHRLSGVRA